MCDIVRPLYLRPCTLGALYKGLVYDTLISCTFGALYKGLVYDTLIPCTLGALYKGLVYDTLIDNLNAELSVMMPGRDGVNKSDEMRLDCLKHAKNLRLYTQSNSAMEEVVE